LAIEVAGGLTMSDRRQGGRAARHLPAVAARRRRMALRAAPLGAAVGLLLAVAAAATHSNLALLLAVLLAAYIGGTYAAVHMLVGSMLPLAGFRLDARTFTCFTEDGGSSTHPWAGVELLRTPSLLLGAVGHRPVLLIPIRLCAGRDQVDAIVELAAQGGATVLTA
jgi:hypothetical protein